MCLTSLQATDNFAEELVKDVKETMDVVRLNPQPPSGVVSVVEGDMGCEDRVWGLAGG